MPLRVAANMEKIVPAIGSRVSGPLGVCHLPRLWAKVLAHATGRLPDDYRHGTGGLDEQLFEDLGLDADAFIRFVAAEFPKYPRCEAWVREHATNLTPAAVAQFNRAVWERDKKPASAAASRRYIGALAPSTANVALLNDLDDWKTVHAQLTTGTLPPPVASSLNAYFSELLKTLLVETRADRALVRLDLPEHGFDPAEPAVEVRLRPPAAGSLATEEPLVIGRAGAELAVGTIVVSAPPGAAPWSPADAGALRRAAREAEKVLEAVVRGD